MVELQFLGGALLKEAGVPLSGPATRRHPRALLALLVMAPSNTLTRLKAIGVLWPDVAENTARNRLTSILYQLRQTLGSDAIESVSGGLRLNPRRVECDVWRFREALNREDLVRATELYGGPFLDGFFLDGAQSFDERVALERHDLHRAWSEAVRDLAERARDGGRHEAAVRWWRTLAAADPLDSSVAMGLVSALAAAGNRGGALRSAEEHIRRLRDELDAEPEAAFHSLVERVRAAPTPVQAVVSAPATPAPTLDDDPRPGLAVLPFETLTGARTSSLAEGVHSGILTRLSEIAGLSVIARGSVRRFRGTDQPASVIGAELGARWILEGDVQTREGHFRVRLRLVDSRADRQVWGRSWSGQLSADAYFRVQAEIAQDVVESLPLSASTGERLLLAQQPTEELEAYRLCAEGQMRLDLRSRTAMEQALTCFERALELDPGYAPARVGVANALGLLHAYGHRDVSVLPRAESAIRRALEIDPRSAEAHAALGRLLGQQRQAPAARRHLRRAIELKPSYAEAHNWAAVGHTISGRPGEALRSAQRAVALNPLSSEAVYNLGLALLINGRTEEALRESRRTRELEPTYDSGLFLEALALYELGRFQEAAGRLEDLDLPWAGPAPRTALALAHAAAGDLDETEKLVAALRAEGHSFDEGLGRAALGQKTAALEALGRARFDGFDFAVTYWPTVSTRYLFSEVWARLRDDSAYAELVDRIDRSWGLT